MLLGIAIVLAAFFIIGKWIYCQVTIRRILLRLKQTVTPAVDDDTFLLTVNPTDCK